MSGSFGSFNTALSGLRYQQIALDIASTNVANSTTEGYVRRRVVGETMGAAAAPAMWSRSTEVGSGVRASRVDRMVDPFLDARSRAEHGKQAYLDLQAEALARVETGLAEPSATGVGAALTHFRSSLHDVVNAPDSSAARGQMLASAATVADAIRLQAHQVSDEAGDQRNKLLSTVAEVNTVAGDLAATNRSIAISRLSETDTATLMDARDRLSLRLAELTGATATIQDDGTASVKLNGVAMVTGQNAEQLTITAGVNPDGTADGNPLGFALGSPGTAVTLPQQGGQVGAIADLLDNTLPGYLADLSTVAKSFADAMNTQHQAGFDAAGNPGAALFSYTGTDVAGTLQVALTDPALVAASGVPGGVLDASNADAMVDQFTVEGDYQRLVNSFGTTVASVQRLGANQKTLTTQVDSSREQLAGVSLDEETVNMLTAQRAYEAAARVMTTLDSVLDTLINRTGLVR